MFRNLLPLVLGLVIGAGASQLPEFVQQYAQRVGGAHDALTKVVQEFRTDAADSNLSVEEALSTYQTSDATFLRERGARMAETLRRAENLAIHSSELARSGPFMRLWVFLRGNDTDITRATAAVYQPAVPLTLEGLVLAAIGFMGGNLTGSGLQNVVARRRVRRV